jgi:copper resistance protein B
MLRKILLGAVLALNSLQIVQAAGVDDPIRTMLIMDKFEILNNDERSREWEGSFCIGYDIDKLYLYSQGEATKEGLEASQNELVYSRAIAPFWDIQAGIAYDKNSDDSRTWGELAIAGLAPYFFEARAAPLLNDEGNVGLRLDLEYEALITQKLILTPSLEADFYTKDDPVMHTGSGLSSVEAGLRLRYEIIREFAPYIGVNWSRAFGTAQVYAPPNDTSFLAGIRFWF